MVIIKELDCKYSGQLAEVLSTDEKLHRKLSPNSEMTTISALEYMQGCKNWEAIKNGKCFAIVWEKQAVGSISFIHKDDETASVGYWLKSDMWGRGICTQAFKHIIILLQNTGYKYVTASILKENIASKRIWEGYNTTFRKDDKRYYPIIKL